MGVTGFIRNGVVYSGEYIVTASYAILAESLLGTIESASYAYYADNVVGVVDSASFVTDPNIAYENEENTFTEDQEIQGGFKVINSLSKFNVGVRGIAVGKESASAALDIYGDLKVSGSIILQATSSDPLAGELIYSSSNEWYVGVE